MNLICPMCGYPDLVKPAYNKGTPSFDFCGCCDFQFGWTDRDLGYTYDQWRKKWIAEGMKWDRGKSEPPKGWDPHKQLADLLASGNAR